MGRASVPPEHLLKASLLICLYSCQVRSNLRTRGGVKVYHAGMDVQHERHPAAGVSRSR